MGDFGEIRKTGEEMPDQEMQRGERESAWGIPIVNMTHRGELELHQLANMESTPVEGSRYTSSGRDIRRVFTRRTTAH